ncbi:chloride channel [Nitzschia inconspicua]|uniref:Chloride channel n=1 Tax=Nitzschia inconspicua TaxID=303405 RepID=A0A9K3Q8F2_9STRA|nr:chloride channel [Nitzschia inconspicua]
MKQYTEDSAGGMDELTTLLVAVQRPDEESGFSTPPSKLKRKKRVTMMEPSPLSAKNTNTDTLHRTCSSTPSLNKQLIAAGETLTASDRKRRVAQHSGSLDFDRVVNTYSIQAKKDLYGIIEDHDDNDESSYDSEERTFHHGWRRNFPKYKQLPRKEKFFDSRATTRWGLTIACSLMSGLTTVVLVASTEKLVYWRTNYMNALLTSSDSSMVSVFKVFGWYVAANILLAGTAAVLCIFWSPEAVGSGIPEVIGYLNGIRVKKFNRKRLLIVKMVGSFLSVGSSLAVGMEGPLVCIGAIVGASLAHVGSLLSWVLTTFFSGYQSPALTRLWIWATSDLTYFANDAERSNLITIGAACGFAASFGAPIGGLLFILNDISSFFEQSMFLRVLVANALGTFCLALYRGDLSSYGAIQFGTYDEPNDKIFVDRFVEIPFWFILGGIMGVMGGFFCMWFDRVKRWSDRKFDNHILRMARISYITLATSAIMFFLPTMGWLCHDLAEYEEGASLGGVAGILLEKYVDNGINPSTFALLGVAAMMAGIQRSTISTCVVLVEGTGQIRVLLPVITVVVVSNYFAYLVHKDGIYDVLLKIKGYPYLEPAENKQSLDIFEVREIMSSPVVTVQEKERAISLVKLLTACPHNGFPVVDKRGQFKGLVRRNQIVALIECGVFHKPNPDDDISSVSSRETQLFSPKPGAGSYQSMMHWALHVKDDRYDDESPNSQYAQPIQSLDSDEFGETTFLLHVHKILTDVGGKVIDGLSPGPVTTRKIAPRPSFLRPSATNNDSFTTRWITIGGDETMPPINTESLSSPPSGSSQDEDDATQGKEGSPTMEPKRNHGCSEASMGTVDSTVCSTTLTGSVQAAPKGFARVRQDPVEGNVVVSWLHPAHYDDVVNLEAVMNRGTYCIPEHFPVSKAYSLFTKLGLRWIVVVGGERGCDVVGILTRQTLLNGHIYDQTGISMSCFAS